jgi:kynurenine formamidase
VDDTTPFVFFPMPPNFNTDRWSFGMAGAVHSHLDSLCHIVSPATASPRVYPVRMVYNNRPLTTNNTAGGCVNNGIDNVAVQGVYTRGILYDATLIPHLREGNHPWLAPGTAVTRADIEELERIEGVTAGKGDVVLLYTGRWKRRAATAPWFGSCTSVGAVQGNCGWAGWWYDNIPWFYERDIAQFGNDAINEVLPANLDAYTTQPYHGFQAATGWAHYDNLDLEALAAVTKQLRRYEFLFAVAPYPIVGGVTSPLNPLAIF